MIKILFENEEGLLEIVFSDRVFVDPDAPTDILIDVENCAIRIRIRFTDTDETASFMGLLFECDKINLKEIADDNPGLVITVEENEETEDFYTAIEDALAEYWESMENSEDGQEEER